MSTIINGLFLSSNLEHLIEEKTAISLFIDLNKWICPFAYLTQSTGELLCNGGLPDGTYVLLGKISYPGDDKCSFHEVYQFNLVKVSGKDMTIENTLNNYPQLDKSLKSSLNPSFPLYRIGPTKDFKTLKKLYKELKTDYLTIDVLKDKIRPYSVDTPEGKLLRIRLAFERYIRKEI